MILRNAGFLVLFSSVALTAATGQVAPEDTAARIAVLRADWCRYLHTKQVDNAISLYAPDAVFLQPTGERISGRAAIRELFVQVTQTVTIEPVLTSRVLEASGSLAYDSGEYRETLTNVATGAKSQIKGGYLMVLKRQPDGQWRIAQQMWSQSP